MIPRVPEHDLMDDPAQAAAYAAADFADVNQVFVHRFCELYPDIGDAHVVDLGCGPADIPIRLCRALPHARVTAIDGSEPMLVHGRRAVEQAGLGPRVEIRCGVLPGAVPAGCRFDAVVSNSLLHHLTDPGVLWHEVRAVGRPGAAVLVVDLFRPETPGRARAIVDEQASGEHEILRRDFFRSLLAAFTADEVREQLRMHDLGHLAVEQMSDRHLAVHGRLH
ncbi:class I SAM-dependent methyltransferase [Myxococcota bacterium]